MSTEVLEEKISWYLEAHTTPKRVALSVRYPFLRPWIIFLKRLYTNTIFLCNKKISHSYSKQYFPRIVARHQSVLRRKLGDSNPRLQEQKIINIRTAIEKFDGVIIEPGKIFSFWKILGEVSYKNGYVDGMLISRGKVVEWVGGGLCQLANLLYWLWLHAPSEVIERYHHSLDLFPDSGRVLPFGSGATIVQNYIDLQIKNISPFPLQLKLWLTDTHLKWQILSPEIIPEKYHIFEKNHTFVKKDTNFFRYNEIYREELISGNILKTEKISENFAPVVYPIDEIYCKKNNFSLIHL